MKINMEQEMRATGSSQIPGFENCAVPKRSICLINKYLLLLKNEIRGAWVAQLVERLTSAQVMISRL